MSEETTAVVEQEQEQPELSPHERLAKLQEAEKALRKMLVGVNTAQQALDDARDLMNAAADEPANFRQYADDHETQQALDHLGFAAREILAIAVEDQEVLKMDIASAD